MPTVGIYVSISEGDGIYKHWAIFIDGPNEKALLQVKGSDGRFRYEPETEDVRQSPTLVELIHLCDVDDAKASTIKALASGVNLKSESPGWNCQDYVLDLLGILEAKKIVKGDEDYLKQKAHVVGQLEGLQ